MGMTNKKYKRQIELNRKKFAREELVSVEIGYRNKKTGVYRAETLDEEIIRKAMKGENDAIVEVSIFMKKKIEQDKRLFFSDMRDATGTLKEGKEAPTNNGAISWPLAKFVTAKMISRCHKEKKLMPPQLHRLMLLVLGDDTFLSKNVEAYPRKRRACDFAVAFPSASLRQIADYAGKGTSPNSAKKWCVRRAENLLNRMANDPERKDLIKSIMAECGELSLKIPKDDPSKTKGIYTLLQKEMRRRAESKARKAEVIVQAESV
jgi:hypothetical protein